MTEGEDELSDVEVGSELVGVPVTQSRRHQGKSRESYLNERPGRDTWTALDVSGITRLQQRRKGIVILGVVGILALIGGAILRCMPP